MSEFTLHLGDSREVLKTFAEASIDSIVTDPPYGLEFMGKEWDAPWKAGFTESPAGTYPDGRGQTRRNPACSNCGSPARGKTKCSCAAPSFDNSPERLAALAKSTGFQAWCEEWARECLRVLKPGGHLLAFSGTRTYHRMVCAIEDAGFDIRDQIGWLYGSGFPKSHNGEWGGTALKPAWEPIVMARKPLVGTVEANWLAYGTGALNVDGCRVGWPDGVAPEIGTPGWGGPAKKSTAVPGQDGDTVDRLPPSPLGRWPANIIHDGSDEVVAAFPEAPGQMGPIKYGDELKTDGVYGAMKRGTRPGGFGNVGADKGDPVPCGPQYDDTGSAARFFYCAKASQEDRNEGAKNVHPTVKPTDLMRYLCRLVTPKGGLVLDPFMGSGSTGKAAMLENFSFVGIDMTPEYVEIARARIDFARRQGYQPDLLESA